MKLFLYDQPTPIGTLVIAADAADRVHAAAFAEHVDRLRTRLLHDAPDLMLLPGAGPGAAGAAFERYFDGALDALHEIAVAPAGTPGQQAVWAAVRAIPAGATRTYGMLARALGRPNGARGVGAANAANPIAILVPCHRLVGQDGSLRGYAWGLERKAWLLAHEQRHATPRDAVPVSHSPPSADS
ncbi:methylated-DNA--[protein]-cysteine S-methyltransferase [Burkholderia sp. FERM BP-3421]|jgi:methylated-DNA-[protein]-cysteine S-methyltransferase|uniref:methylated-DNA--[protein]-cysteine S-methyltransferase n=1 Tax=Burkholderia sp. FERM BP-3421 TaxID=1494466 RepID=UPI00235F9841|nr:methylated-DNA--[protein]-cysteine S-methyltransferase [Burkholderia sp. FERM BP-3421]WDD93126.1 methylated-DNA--[protein]-cysteine S-methyltransferase [Burkholderia sp. FERM BP-3421]